MTAQRAEVTCTQKGDEFVHHPRIIELVMDPKARKARILLQTLRIERVGTVIEQVRIEAQLARLVAVDLKYTNR